MTRLRIALPPLDGLTSHSELAFAQLDRNGSIRHIASSTPWNAWGKPSRLTASSVSFHPTDSILTGIDLPPLSAARTAAAVTRLRRR